MNVVEKRRVRYLNKFFSDHSKRNNFFEWCSVEVPRLLYVLDEWTLECQVSEYVRVRDKEYTALKLPAIKVPPSVQRRK